MADKYEPVKARDLGAGDVIIHDGARRQVLAVEASDGWTRMTLSGNHKVRVPSKDSVQRKR